MGDRPDLEKVAQVLAAASSVVVIGHIGPDGDALGSAIGLARAARAVGKDAYATFGEPFVTPTQLAFLNLDTLAGPKALERDFDVAIAVDTGALHRLGDAVSIAEAAQTFVVIDHHKSNEGFGDIAIVDGEAAATAELVFDLLHLLEWPIDADTAEALYVGLVSDTGRFQYSSTSTRTHAIAGELIRLGVSPAKVSRHLYEEARFGYLKVAGAVLSRVELISQVALVWSVVTVEDLKSAGVGYEETDGLIDLIRVADEAEAALLLKELGDGRTKGSLRSRGGIDVGAIAVDLGGGGHHNAAGFTYEGSPSEVVSQVVRGLREGRA